MWYADHNILSSFSNSSFFIAFMAHSSQLCSALTTSVKFSWDNNWEPFYLFIHFFRLYSTNTSFKAWGIAMLSFSKQQLVQLYSVWQLCCFSPEIVFTGSNIFYSFTCWRELKKVNACAMKNDSLDVLLKGLWTKLSSAPTVNKPWCSWRDMDKLIQFYYWN